MSMLEINLIEEVESMASDPRMRMNFNKAITESKKSDLDPLREDTEEFSNATIIYDFQLF